MKNINKVANSFTYVCETCGHVREFELERKYKRVKLTCKCGEVVVLSLNFRKYHRKDTNIYGKVTVGHSTFDVIINNISLLGYRIKILFELKDEIILNRVVQLSFILPDKQQTEINNNVKILYKDSEGFYGCEMVDYHEYSNAQKCKGFWLRQND